MHVPAMMVIECEKARGNDIKGGSDWYLVLMDTLGLEDTTIFTRRNIRRFYSHCITSPNLSSHPNKKFYAENLLPGIPITTISNR